MTPEALSGTAKWQDIGDAEVCARNGGTPPHSILMPRTRHHSGSFTRESFVVLGEPTVVRQMAQATPFRCAGSRRKSAAHPDEDDMTTLMPFGKHRGKPVSEKSSGRIPPRLVLRLRGGQRGDQAGDTCVAGVLPDSQGGAGTGFAEPGRGSPALPRAARQALPGDPCPAEVISVGDGAMCQLLHQSVIFCADSETWLFRRLYGTPGATARWR